MANQHKIPTLNLSELTSFHGETTEWMPKVSQSKQKDYHVNKLDDITDKANFKVLPHRKEFHDFIYLKKGISVRSKGLNKYEFGDGSIFFLPAFQITQHKSMSIDAEGFFCHFDESLFDFLPKKYLSDRFSFFQFQSNPVVQLSKETQQSVELILKRLMVLYETGEKTKKNLIASYLLTLFEEVKKEVFLESKKSKNSYFRITEAYKQLLTEHIYEYKQISDYADKLHITPNYLNKCVKASINKTAQDLLKEMMVLEAKSLIKYSDLHVSEIAVKLCDQTPSNFARFFKKQTGITPKEYAQMD
ncbi:helix-turn-helix domain-containing protein [Thalassobellus suaedae]|uniref:Helix-turn-helix domain-containing protein n=1 Tax=Thalassobellus suaedae TaxID=3074124 RepID=A0ABY9Y2X0_9FLAO|nr:helix-turn-helix domain-containing protein [Flavobacteriaceae bacterium HL-DH10]